MLNINQERTKLLHDFLNLNNPPVAMKLISDNSEVPPAAVRPVETSGKHIALCQAFALSRRQGKTVYMQKADHWCWGPLVAYGMVPCESGSPAAREIARYMGTRDPKKAAAMIDRYPRLPFGKYSGILSAPLDQAGFAPDILLIYCSNSQLRMLLMAITAQTGDMLDSSFTPLDSCVYSVIPPLQNGDYRITIPDPGEYERAMTGENDIILSVPYQRMDEFFDGVKSRLDIGMTVRSFFPMMKEDFTRPPFYNRLFSMWGLDTGEDWDK